MSAQPPRFGQIPATVLRDGVRGRIAALQQAAAPAAAGWEDRIPQWQRDRVLAQLRTLERALAHEPPGRRLPCDLDDLSWCGIGELG